MKVKELKALLENIVDDLPVFLYEQGQLKELKEDDLVIVTFESAIKTALLLTKEI